MMQKLTPKGLLQVPPVPSRTIFLFKMFQCGRSALVLSMALRLVLIIIVVQLEGDVGNGHTLYLPESQLYGLGAVSVKGLLPKALHNQSAHNQVNIGLGLILSQLLDVLSQGLRQATIR